MRLLPVARQTDLILRELPDEVLVYDLKTHKAHCLNRTAALIWENCDGQKSVTEMARLLERELKSPISEQVVMLGLEELAAYSLLQEETWEAPKKASLSRRQLIKKLGRAAAISLPLIISITAPTAVQAASGAVDPCVANPGAEGCPCVFDGQCDSFNCNVGVCGPPL
jgi:hypothetical protein